MRYLRAMEINSFEIKKMRKKQLYVTNAILLTVLIIYFIIIYFNIISFSTFYLILGIIMLIQATVSLRKGYSTKSFIPIIERVAIYEREKMGKEWQKQRKGIWILNYFLSGLFFLQFYLNRNLSLSEYEFDLPFMFIVLLLLLGLMNVSMYIHFRKVDKATSELDLKGYTWKSYGIRIVLVIFFTFLILMVIIFSLLNSLTFE
jgi:hypothetical protein